MSYPVQDALEQAVNNQVTALIGNSDVNLNTIVKMSLISEMKQIDVKEMEDVLARLVSNNQIEKYYIEKEYGLTMDCGGNIVSINYIQTDAEQEKEYKSEKDIGSIISEPEGSK